MTAFDRVELALKNTAPFDDGYVVGRRLKQGGNRVSFTLNHPSQSKDPETLWVMPDEGDDGQSLRKIYNTVETVIGRETRGRNRIFITVDGIRYLLVRVSGKNLETHLPPVCAVEILGREIAETLVALQKQRLVHRNIKPRNVYYHKGH